MKIGILVGRENTFPPALINHINSTKSGVFAEYVKIGGINMEIISPYCVILDRISHEVPFYRAYLKQAALSGTIIVNDPFWWSADDKFFNYSLAERVGVKVPRTVLLPQKAYQERISSESLRNLQFPLDWEEIASYIGFPAILKPHDGGGWRNVYRVNNMDELIHTYDKTGQMCMTLQEFIDFDRYVRCYCVGKKHILVMPYDPTQPYPNQYVNVLAKDYISKELYDRVVNEATILNEALGYDINTVEFAIRNNIPYAIDFMNPAPDADSFSVGIVNFNWIISHVSDLLIKYAKNGKTDQVSYNWVQALKSTLPTAKA